MTDLMGGQVDLMCDQTPSTAPLIASGKVKALAVTTSRRLMAPALAALPTLDESGLKGFSMSNWHGLYAPRGTPMPVVEKLNGALRAALADAAFVRHEEEVGAVIATDARSSPAGHRKFVEAETARWTPVIKAAGQFAD
jgi:tripartite-type tricarboxylate transporter receptor subunit TctC